MVRKKFRVVNKILIYILFKALQFIFAVCLCNLKEDPVAAAIQEVADLREGDLDVALLNEIVSNSLIRVRRYTLKRLPVFGLELLKYGFTTTEADWISHRCTSGRGMMRRV